MKTKSVFAAAAAALALSASANAQTNLQVFYDAGRGYATTTFEMFKGDNWGNTFFFIDHYYTTADQRSAGAGSVQNGTYFEIERCINFWQNTQLGNLSLELEYDGGSFGSGVACIGANYFMHSADFKNTFNVALLYDKNFGYDCSTVPVKFSGVWGCQDFLGLEGLRFSGFIDIWGVDRNWDADGGLCAVSGNPVAKTTKFSILTEPQLWYNVGKFFKCDNLNVGGEVELSYNFSGAAQGFVCNPAVGVKWIF